MARCNVIQVASETNFLSRFGVMLSCLTIVSGVGLIGGVVVSSRGYNNNFESHFGTRQRRVL